MTTRFPPVKTATSKNEFCEVSGQLLEQKLEFSLKGLDYIFVKDWEGDDPTLTYVGDEERGRLAPSQYAADESWGIADRLMRLSLNKPDLPGH